jgi:hypothetical protein
LLLPTEHHNNNNNTIAAQTENQSRRGERQKLGHGARRTLSAGYLALVGLQMADEPPLDTFGELVEKREESTAAASHGLLTIVGVRVRCRVWGGGGRNAYNRGGPA